MTIPGPRWLKLTLLASVALNLLLIGTMAGRYLHHRHEREMRQMPAVARMIQQMPEDARQGMQAAMGQRQGELRQRQQAIREQRRAVAERFAAEPFDRAAAEAAFAELRQRQQDARAIFHNGLIEAVAGMPAERRKQIAEFVGGRSR
ncbi:MAG: periplasmic heavy metal sensor [Alphaproteobacteria bacterium]|nr:periplasmic heavy metal sensor [Alphaproteobacteria bacterium]